jgi:hypothetical protein
MSAKMPYHPAQRRFDVGFRGPASGSRALGLVVPIALSIASAGCGDDERTRILEPEQVAMDESVMPAYQDDELTIYEVKKGVQFPIIAPDDEAMAALNDKPMDPYGRQPWITLDDVRVQLSWTLTNLDDELHEVEVLIDPWNEFGRYYPGLTLIDAENGEYMPNISGINEFHILEGANTGERSRRHGVMTYDDLDELARDFGTVMNLILNEPTSYPGGGMLEEGESALPTYVNHTFDFQNRSSNDPLINDWIPGVVAGLTGIDMGLRTSEPARIALEVVVEITDRGSDKVRREGQDDPLLPPPDEIITIATQ